MGLASAADYLQQVRKYSKSQAMNLQRVGKFLKGNADLALDSNGNAISLSAMVQLLESCESETQARKLISDGTVNALTPVKKLKKQIDKLNGKEIAADAESKEVDGDSNSEGGNTAPSIRSSPVSVRNDAAVSIRSWLASINRVRAAFCRSSAKTAAKSAPLAAGFLPSVNRVIGW